MTSARVAALFWCSVVLVCGQGVAQEKSRLDVLFIAIDDLNDWTTLFDKDNPIKTPNMDRLRDQPSSAPASRSSWFRPAHLAACIPIPCIAYSQTGEKGPPLPPAG